LFVCLCICARSSHMGPELII